MPNKKNPTSNPAIQVLLDLKDLGYGMQVAPLLSLLEGNRKLQSDVQKKWNAHMYHEKDMVFMQMTLSQAYMTLSGDAVKLLVFLGNYAHQTGLLRVSQKDLEAATMIKRTMLRRALKELVEAGAIAVAVPSARHAAPVYMVNPDVIVKGNRKATRNFKSGASGAAQYLLNRQPELRVVSTTVNTGEMIFNDITVTTEKEPLEDAATSTKSSARKTNISRHNHTKSPSDGQDDGQQMTVYDYPELIPDDVNDPNLPFN